LLFVVIKTRFGLIGLPDNHLVLAEVKPEIVLLERSTCHPVCKESDIKTAAAYAALSRTTLKMGRPFATVLERFKDQVGAVAGHLLSSGVDVRESQTKDHLAAFY